MPKTKEEQVNAGKSIYFPKTVPVTVPGRNVPVIVRAGSIFMVSDKATAPLSKIDRSVTAEFADGLVNDNLAEWRN